MKNKDLLKLVESKETLFKLKGFKFIKSIYLNFKLIEEHLEVMKMYFSTDEKVKEFFDKKKIILEKYAEKDENGKPKFKNENGIIDYEVDLNNEDLKNELNNLIEEYKDILEKYKNEKDELDKFLEKECDIKFHKILEKDVPEDINLEQLELIADWIKFI